MERVPSTPGLSVTQNLLGSMLKASVSPCVHAILVSKSLLGCKYGFLPFEDEEPYTLAEFQNILFPEGLCLFDIISALR